MQIKTDTRVITGEHLGVPFEYESGLIKINGLTYSRAEIKALVEIANLLDLEGLRVAETHPRRIQQVDLARLWDGWPEAYEEGGYQ